MKWIAAIAGYFLFRFPGAVIGFLLGSFLEKLGGGASAQGTVFTSQKVSPQDFELHLLSLCSVVIKADGTVSASEMEYVQRYFLQTYGKEKANAIFRTFNEVVKKREISIEKIGAFLNQRTRYEVRLQLIHFLFGIAQSDGSISPLEIAKIQEIARHLRVGNSDFESVKAMFVKAVDNAYKILEISSDATADEVKKAYRTMAKKYHPDRVITDDAAIKKGAEDKFKQVQTAYEEIQKQRGF